MSDKIPNLAFHWEYACKATDGHFGADPNIEYVKRGGTMYISQEANPTGIKLAISGQRMWRRKMVDGHEVSEATLPIVNWSAEGYFIPKEDKISFLYMGYESPGQFYERFDVTDREAEIYAGSVIQAIDNRGVRGIVQIRRMNTNDDFQWIPKDLTGIIL